jgi:hypothetical protein
MTLTLEQLATVGNVVDEDYRHVTKEISPGRPLALPDTYLKWYQLSRKDRTIDLADDAEARAFLAEDVATGRLPISGDLGFVIHHLCGEHIHLLLVCTWRDNNEMWQTTYLKDARQDDSFDLIPQTTHRGVICVWEFGAVAHEHQAWTRYLRSNRDAEAKRAYAESQFTGTISVSCLSSTRRSSWTGGRRRPGGWSRQARAHQAMVVSSRAGTAGAGTRSNEAQTDGVIRSTRTPT